MKKNLVIFALTVLVFGGTFLVYNNGPEDYKDVSVCSADGLNNDCSSGDKKIENNINNFDQISVHEFKNEIALGDAILIDVRTAEELPIYGKISNKQILLDINDEKFFTKILRLNKSKKYLIYCWHGNRSQVARAFMEKNGFVYAKDLRGGIDAWNNLGEEILK